MMEELVLRIINVILLMLLSYLFVLPLYPMINSRIRNAFVFIGGVVLIIGFQVCIPNLHSMLFMDFVLKIHVVILCMYIVYGKKSWDVIYCSVWTIMIYYCVSIISQTFQKIFWIGSIGFEYKIMGYVLICIVIYMLLEITLFRWMPRNGKYHAGPKRTLSAVFVLLLSQCTTYFYYRGTEDTILIFLVQVYCVTFLYLQAELFKESEMNQELSMMEQIWYQQKKQYEISKEQMQVIDRKCHDLKYQVSAMRRINNPQEREKNLKELEQSIRIYDSFVKTGNNILDTLLSEKSLVCEARDITMNCVIDGKQLTYMDSVDLYVLFGNAIDNAIEAVENYPKRDHRFIDVCVMQKQNFVYIRISNPILEHPKYEGDLPKTTKMNKKYHGLGLKSIRNLAQKYGGNMTVHTEMNCFILEVLLPQKMTTI